jgi:hypothetical protein
VVKCIQLQNQLIKKKEGYNLKIWHFSDSHTLHSRILVPDGIEMAILVEIAQIQEINTLMSKKFLIL